MTPYRSPPPATPAPRSSWLHRLAHWLHLHACTCDVVESQGGYRWLVYTTCATCGERSLLAARRSWTGTYVANLVARRVDFPAVDAASTLASSIEDLETKHAASIAKFEQLDRDLRDRIAAAHR